MQAVPDQQYIHISVRQVRFFHKIPEACGMPAVSGSEQQELPFDHLVVCRQLQPDRSQGCKLAKRRHNSRPAAQISFSAHRRTVGYIDEIASGTGVEAVFFRPLIRPVSISMMLPEKMISRHFFMSVRIFRLRAKFIAVPAGMTPMAYQDRCRGSRMQSKLTVPSPPDTRHISKLSFSRTLFQFGEFSLLSLKETTIVFVFKETSNDVVSAGFGTYLSRPADCTLSVPFSILHPPTQFLKPYLFLRYFIFLNQSSPTGHCTITDRPPKTPFH